MGLGYILIMVVGLVFLLAYLWVDVQVWKLAEAENKNPVAWVLLGFLVTPFVAYRILLSICYREPWEK